MLFAILGIVGEGPTAHHGAHNPHQVSTKLIAQKLGLGESAKLHKPLTNQTLQSHLFARSSGPGSCPVAAAYRSLPRLNPIEQQL